MDLGMDWIESVIKFKKGYDSGESEALKVEVSGLNLKRDMVDIYTAGLF